MIEIVSPNERIVRRVGDGTFTLRRIDAETHRKITEKHTVSKNVRDNHSGEISVKSVRDDQAVMEESLCYAIVDWEGVRAPGSETDLPCTDENKKKLPVPVIEAILLFLSQAYHT